MDYFVRSIRRTVIALTVLGTCVFLAVMLVVVTNVILRTSGGALIGTQEAVEMMMVITVAFSLGYCALMQSHIVVNIIIVRLRQPVRTVLAVITTLLSLGIWTLIAWRGIDFARKQWLLDEATHIMEWPKYPLRFVFAFGVVILCLVLFTDLINLIRGSVKNEPD